MHRIFQGFVDQLSTSSNEPSLRAAMADAATALDLHCFAYLSVSRTLRTPVRLISTYPQAWTSFYLQRHYECSDPVVGRAASCAQPFPWGLGVPSHSLSPAQEQLLDEAAEFGIRYGYTIPIHDRQGFRSAMTFATAERRRAFGRNIKRAQRILPSMAICFHAHVCRKLVADYAVDGVLLSPREFECLQWAAQGKSAWEIGHIVGISRRTAAFHLDNAKEKLGVHSIIQAVARLVASRPKV